MLFRSEAIYCGSMKDRVEEVKAIGKDGKETILEKVEKEFTDAIITVNGYAGSGALVGSASGAIVTINHAGKFIACIDAADGSKNELKVTGYLVVRTTTLYQIDAKAKGLSFAGGVAMGAVVVTVTNTISNESYTKNLTGTVGEFVLISVNVPTITVESQGTSGGLVAAGTAQSISITEKSSTKSRMIGKLNDLKVERDAYLASYLISSITSHAKGCSVAGFASGGLTIVTVNVTADVYANIESGVTFNVGGDLFVQSYSDVKSNLLGQASAAAIGGSLNNVTVTNDYALNTNTQIQDHATIKVGGDINIFASTNK